MGKIIILGSGSAISEEGHENTQLLVEHGPHCILIDCASSPKSRLEKAGIHFDQVTDLILTHFHPDHVAGVPVFLVESWLMGRRKPLHIFGLRDTIDRTEAVLDLYEWKKWPNFYPVIFQRLADQDLGLVIDSSGLRILSSPVKHMIPTIGLRIEFLQTEKVLAYSCDTEPSPAVIDLAYKADVLIHEATGESIGHSSAAQAAMIARQAEARSLYLIHYQRLPGIVEKMRVDAQHVFSGKVVLAEDGMVLEF